MVVARQLSSVELVRQVKHGGGWGGRLQAVNRPISLRRWWRLYVQYHVHTLLELEPPVLKFSHTYCHAAHHNIFFLFAL